MAADGCDQTAKVNGSTRSIVLYDVRLIFIDAQLVGQALPGTRNVKIGFMVESFATDVATRHGRFPKINPMTRQSMSKWLKCAVGPDLKASCRMEISICDYFANDW